MAYRKSTRQQDRFGCAGPRKGVNAANPKCRASATVAPVLEQVLAEVGQLVVQVGRSRTQSDDEFFRKWRALRRLSRLTVELTPEVRSADESSAEERWRQAALQLVDGRISRTRYAKIRANAKEIARAAAGFLDDVNPVACHVPELRPILTEACQWQASMDAHDWAGTRACLVKLVEHVTPYRVGKNRYKVAIEWTKLGQRLRWLTEPAEMDVPPEGLRT